MTTGSTARDPDARAALLAELRSNRVAIGDYAAALRRLLFDVMDAEQFEMTDWEWQWPEHAPPQLGFACVLGHGESTDAVARAYDACRDVPPALAGWEADWDGDGNRFLAYLLARVDAWHDRLIAAIDAALDAVMRR